MKTAIVTGICGQDGAYLANLLLSKGYKVVGAERRSASGSAWRLERLGIEKEIIFEEFELLESSTVFNILKKYEPQEFYNLAAQSFVKASFDTPIFTGNATGLGVTRILDAIRNFNQDIRFYQASSSEMFGKVQRYHKRNLHHSTLEVLMLWLSSMAIGWLLIIESLMICSVLVESCLIMNLP